MNTPTAYLSQEDTRCTHKRAKVGEAQYKAGPNLYEQEVSCWMQKEYCGTCAKDFWVRQNHLSALKD